MLERLDRPRRERDAEFAFREERRLIGVISGPLANDLTDSMPQHGSVP
jgi:hypothetical protein